MPRRKRLLALEIRASRLGFVVLEEPARLLDWGVRSFGEQKGKLGSTVSDRIATLLAFHSASVIVARTRKYLAAARNRRFRTIMSAVRTEARRHSAEFRALTVRQVTNYFAASGEATKYDIATRLAREFEELSWKLPSRRKIYQSEPLAMLVFDALANGVACLGGRTSSASCRQQRP